MFSAARLRSALAFVAILAVILSTPLGWRVLLARFGPRRAETAALPLSYLPALEERRARAPFDPAPIADLQQIAPSYVIVGDSMAGRIDFAHLEQIAGGSVAPVLQNATGSAYWYLVLKNYVAASGIHPKAVIVFFRDTNLTDPLFRIGDSGPRHLDEVAHDDEPELGAAIARRVDPWFRVHHAIARLYASDEARAWLEPTISSWAAARVVRYRREQPAFVERVNEMFSLEHLRAMRTADMDVDDRETDFDATVGDSVLPLMLDVARAHGLRLCFVRVLRRTREDGSLTPQSERMSRYVRDLRAYVERRGGVLRDDRDDPVMATIAYADGDHIARGDRARYTDRFFATTPIFK